MTFTLIAIGSNLASPLKQVKAALRALNNVHKSQVITISPFYRTKPLGPQDQPSYLNAVVELETTLNAETLLDNIQSIELEQGRVRKAERWGPRPLDLDILLFGDEIINTDRLTVPHYDMKNRAFILWPLFDIVPQLIFPNGESLLSVLNTLNTEKPTPW